MTTSTRLRTAIAAIEGELLTPALVVDLDAVEHNVAAIVKRVGGPRSWRPHIKTVKQSRILRVLMQRRVDRLKCATLDELALCLDTAERVHPEGEVDVLLAQPPTKTVCRGVAELAREHEGARIRLLADSPDHLRALGDWLAQAEAPSPMDVLLDVDLGMHRTGTAPETWADAATPADAGAAVAIVGLHGYDGHVAWDDRETAHAGLDRLVDLARALPAGAVRVIVTSGSHSFVHALAHEALRGGPWAHEVSPGTLVLSDLRSRPAAEALGLRQAAFVAARVISTPQSERATLDAGSKAIAPDRPPPCCAVLDHPELEPLVPSEEHLPLRVHGGEVPRFGELLWLVPDHVCTTVNLYRRVVYVRGDALVGFGSVEASAHTARLGDRRG